jgi:hypothetical protein
VGERAHGHEEVEGVGEEKEESRRGDEDSDRVYVLMEWAERDGGERNTACDRECG